MDDQTADHPLIEQRESRIDDQIKRMVSAGIELQQAGAPNHEFEDLHALVREGKKSEAMKILHERTGWHLKQCKEFVENPVRAVPIGANSVTPGGVCGAIICFLTLVGGIVWSIGWLNSQIPLPEGVHQIDVAAVTATKIDRREIDPRAIDISASDLLEAYARNEIAADRWLKGKKLSVSGTVDSIGKDIFRAPYITLRSDADRSNSRKVQVTFGSSEEDRLAALRTGSLVRVQGRCTGMFLNIQITDAFLQ